ncbi:hypothetical protein HT574_18985 [Parageobacillus sp. VR-IP]|uniref:hypothetical protein n=1 Tax=Parageobacillus sp. VR-IP TaxID=2742205 RepID=UPI001583724C|nr:hypothetical protein [Parageobacillus sp. VR-IP]NUK32067.1 hypothetical protein [Parageobacillus sp. VR-IP]
MKLNIFINKEINHFIELAAKKMGTSKRNVISIALADILNKSYTQDEIEKLKESIQLDYATTVTINEHVAKKIDRISRYGISKRLFFGYLICDYFYRYYHYFITKDEIDEEKEVNTERDYLQIKLDKTVKDKIVEYCEKQYISINSLFSYYILNKEITVKSFHIKEPELLYLTLGKNVKDMIRKKAIEMNVSYRFFLNLVAAQICQDLSL